MSSTSSNVLFEIKGSLSMCILWHSRSNPVISLTIRGCAIKDWALMWRRVRNETVNGWWVDGWVGGGRLPRGYRFILQLTYSILLLCKDCQFRGQRMLFTVVSWPVDIQWCLSRSNRCQQEHNRPFFVTALKHLLPQRAFLGLTFGAAMRAPDPMSGALTLICQCVWRPSRLSVCLSVHLDRHPAPSCYAGDAQGQL